MDLISTTIETLTIETHKVKNGIETYILKEYIDSSGKVQSLELTHEDGEAILDDDLIDQVTDCIVNSPENR